MTDTNFTPNHTQVNMAGGNILQQLEIAGVPPDSERKFSKMMTGDMFMTEPPAVEWLVENLFARGNLYMLYGNPGSGKTWALLDLMVCVAAGEDWLKMPTKQGNVLLIDEESGMVRLHRRMHKILNGHLVRTPLPITAFVNNNANFGETDWTNELSLVIQQTNASLVVIDALVDVSQGADENDAKKIQPILKNIRMVAQHTNSTIIIIHHTNKNGGYRGSTSIEGEVDMWIRLENSGNNRLTFTTGKERDFGHRQIHATIRFNESQVYLVDSEPVTETPKLGAPHQYVLGYLAKSGRSKVSEIKNHADICAPNSARNAVYKLTEWGLAVRTDNGGRGVDAEFELTGKGLEAAKQL